MSAVLDLFSAFESGLKAAARTLTYRGDPAGESMLCLTYAIFALRVAVRQMFYASCSGEDGFKRGQSIGRKIVEKQSFWGRISRRYMKEYISDRVRKPFNAYLFISRFIELIYVPGVAALGYLGRNRVEILCAEPILDTVYAITIAFTAFLFIQINPKTHKTRFIDYKFKNRNGDFY